jgi:hypothetical protein
MNRIRKSMDDLMAAATPTTGEPVSKASRKKPAANVVQQQLVVQLPDVTLKALKLRALDENTSVRAVLLGALQDAGFPVPAGQAVDFRKVRRA